MKLFVLCALAAATYATHDVSEMRLINDQAFVDKINSNPGLLWKALPRLCNIMCCVAHGGAGCVDVER